MLHLAEMIIFFLPNYAWAPHHFSSSSCFHLHIVDTRLWVAGVGFDCAHNLIMSFVVVAANVVMDVALFVRSCARSYGMRGGQIKQGENYLQKKLKITEMWNK